MVTYIFSLHSHSGVCLRTSEMWPSIDRVEPNEREKATCSTRHIDRRRTDLASESFISVAVFCFLSLVIPKVATHLLIHTYKQNTWCRQKLWTTEEIGPFDARVGERERTFQFSKLQKCIYKRMILAMIIINIMYYIYVLMALCVIECQSNFIFDLPTQIEHFTVVMAI